MTQDFLYLIFNWFYYKSIYKVYSKWKYKSFCKSEYIPQEVIRHKCSEYKHYDAY